MPQMERNSWRRQADGRVHRTVQNSWRRQSGGRLCRIAQNSRTRHSDNRICKRGQQEMPNGEVGASNPSSPEIFRNAPMVLALAAVTATDDNVASECHPRNTTMTRRPNTITSISEDLQRGGIHVNQQGRNEMSVNFPKEGEIWADSNYNFIAVISDFSRGDVLVGEVLKKAEDFVSVYMGSGMFKQCSKEDLQLFSQVRAITMTEETTSFPKRSWMIDPIALPPPIEFFLFSEDCEPLQF
ncbi:hypothetical protein AAC387_Pa05g2754 [Persea americana]